MKYCKICGATCPEGKEICWVCEHERHFNKQVEEECEMCKIPLPESEKKE